MSGFSKIKSATAWLVVAVIMVDKSSKISVFGLQVHSDAVRLGSRSPPVDSPTPPDEKQQARTSLPSEKTGSFDCEPNVKEFVSTVDFRNQVSKSGFLLSWKICKRKLQAQVADLQAQVTTLKAQNAQQQQQQQQQQQTEQDLAAAS